MRPEDISRYFVPGDPRLHPDGATVAFAVVRADLEDDRYESSIWRWDGTNAAPFTHGPGDSRPRWSPDGRTLLFLRRPAEKGGQAQVAVMPAGGGEATVITAFDRGVSEAEWSPDGSRIAVVASTWADDVADLDDEERARRPRRITVPHWRHDGAGFIHDNDVRIYVLDSTASSGDATPEALTASDLRVANVAWRPDGEALAFVASGHERAGYDGANQVYEVPVSGGDILAMVDPGGWSSPSYDGGGALHAVGNPDLDNRPATPGLYRLGDGVHAVAPNLDRDVAVGVSGPAWQDAGGCLVLSEDGGRQVVTRMDGQGGHDTVLGGERYVTGLSANGDGSTLALTIGGATDPGELVLVENGVERTVTSLNAEFRESTPLAEPHYLTVTRDGLDLDVWVYVPEGDGPFPTVFNIHGGPMAQYGWTFFDEFQVQVGAGFAVVATNPRGASGRGTEFMRGEVGTWHMDQPPDALDLVAALDGALDAVDALDADTVGIMGGSYGGLISTKIMSFDHRFKSGIPERGLYNFMSFAGTSDIGLYFDTFFVGERDYDDWTPLWDASPLRTAHRITTPCLVIHSDSDWRCPIEQGEQLYATLLANGVEAEFLRVPGEGHELSRSGSPKHRIERFDAVLDWHRRHLVG